MRAAEEREGRQPGKHPDMTDTGEPGRNPERTDQKACVIRGHDEADGCGRETLDIGADAKHGPLEPVPGHEEADADEQRPNRCRDGSRIRRMRSIRHPLSLGSVWVCEC